MAGRKGTGGGGEPQSNGAASKPRTPPNPAFSAIRRIERALLTLSTPEQKAAVLRFVQDTCGTQSPASQA